MSEVLMFFRLALVSAVLTVAIACGGSDSTPAPSPTPVANGTPVTIVRGAEPLGNQAYSPDQITVAVGATVTWMNADAVAHTSTSDSNGWNSGNIAPGGQFSVAFPTAGTFPYHCTIHPGMVG